MLETTQPEAQVRPHHPRRRQAGEIHQHQRPQRARRAADEKPTSAPIGAATAATHPKRSVPDTAPLRRTIR